MNKLKKRIAVISGMIFILSIITACDKEINITTGLSENTAFEIDNQICSMSQLEIVLLNEKNIMEQLLGEDIWNDQAQEVKLEQDIKDSVKEKMTELYIICLLAEKEKYFLTDSEKEKVKLAAEEYFNTLKGTDLQLSKIKIEDIEDLYSRFLLSQKFYKDKTDLIVKEVSDEEARIIKVMYIYISKDTENYDQTIEKVSDRISAGSDFFSLVKEFSQDSTYEIEFGRGEMDESFEEVAFTLGAGETSSAIFTDKGSFFIKCINDYVVESTEKNKNKIIDKLKQEEFLKIYNSYYQDQIMEFNSKIWNKISFDQLKGSETSQLQSVYLKYFGE